MLVMNYPREHKVYPVTFEIFPATEGETALFTLYEDDEQNIGYLRGEYLRTPVAYTSAAGHYQIIIDERKERSTG